MKATITPLSEAEARELLRLLIRLAETQGDQNIIRQARSLYSLLARDYLLEIPVLT